MQYRLTSSRDTPKFCQSSLAIPVNLRCNSTEGRASAWIRLLWVWSALMMGGQQGAGECHRQRVRDPQLVRSSFCCVIAQPSASCVGNGFGNETRRNGRDGVECGVMAWTVE